VTKLPEERKCIGCRWIFKIKTDSDGKIQRYKARLVAQGFSQQRGIDYVTVRLSVIGNVFLPDVLVGISGFGQAETQLGILTNNKETFIQQTCRYIYKMFTLCVYGVCVGVVGYNSQCVCVYVLVYMPAREIRAR